MANSNFVWEPVVDNSGEVNNNQIIILDARQCCALEAPAKNFLLLAH